MSTFPLDSKVAVWPYVAVVMLPAAAKVPAVGSYSSALAKALVPSNPPATSTPQPVQALADIKSVAIAAFAEIGMSPSEALKWLARPRK
jgi:hypothetical protein